MIQLQPVVIAGCGGKQLPMNSFSSQSVRHSREVTVPPMHHAHALTSIICTILDNFLVTLAVLILFKLAMRREVWYPK